MPALVVNFIVAIGKGFLFSFLCDIRLNGSNALKKKNKNLFVVLQANTLLYIKKDLVALLT